MQSPFYQKTNHIKQAKWNSTQALRFDIHCDDTSVYYNNYIIIKHTDAYAYSNIWLKINIKSPGDSISQSTSIEIPLATLPGQWLGNKFGEYIEQRRMTVLDHTAIPKTDELICISTKSIDYLFNKKGNYEITIEHLMRDLELAEILDIGLRIEKSSIKKTPASNKAISESLSEATPS
jgi:gliding motility-associated lipoprotein GldH